MVNADSILSPYKTIEIQMKKYKVQLLREQLRGFLLDISVFRDDKKRHKFSDWISKTMFEKNIYI